jgi:hypothetical protein
MKKIDPETATPLEYLEYLKSVRATFPYSNSIHSDKTLQKIAIELKKRHTGFLKGIKKNQLQAEPMQGVVEDLFEDLKNPLKNRQVRVRLNDIAIGELQTLEANACCIKVPAGGYVILINTGLMILIYKLAKAFASRVEFQVVEKINRSMSAVQPFKSDNVASFQKFANYVYLNIATYLVYNAPIGPILPVVSLSKYQLNFNSLLLHFAELFVIAHELGHIFEGHLSEASTLKIKIEENEVTVFKNNWNQEYSADIFGLQLLQEKVSNENEQSLNRISAFIGPDFLLTIFDLIEKIGKVKSISHPSANKRRMNLRQHAVAANNEQPLVLAAMLQAEADNVWNLLKK